VLYVFFSVILLASYTANLASFLSFKRTAATITGINDVRTQQLSFGVKAGTSIESFFESSYTDQLYQNMFKFMVPYNNSNDLYEALRAGKIKAVVDDQTSSDYIVNQEPCNTIQVGSTFSRSNFGFVLRKGSPLTEFLSQGILKLKETGMVEQRYNYYYFDLGSCKKSNEDEPSGSASNFLDITDMNGIFFVLAVATVLSGPLLMLEIYIRKHSNRYWIVRTLNYWFCGLTRGADLTIPHMGLPEVEMDETNGSDRKEF